MKIEIEGQIIEASAVAVTIVEDTVPETMQAARRLIEHAHGRKAIVFRRHGEVEQREDGRFECEVELRDNHPSNAPLTLSAERDRVRREVGTGAEADHG